MSTPPPTGRKSRAAASLFQTPPRNEFSSAQVTVGLQHAASSQEHPQQHSDAFRTDEAAPAFAPDESDLSGTATRSVSESETVSQSNDANLTPGLTRKTMKKSSIAAQYFTTIVVKACVACREWLPTCSTHVRACYVFEKVELGLRDRTLYPLPPDVSLQDLLKHSYFHDFGPEAEACFKQFCLDKHSPLDEHMVKHGNGLYDNKFCDSRKVIVNKALPRFLAILNKNTGNGLKSG